MTAREIEGAFFVIGAIIVLGGPILWWIFYRMDEHSSFPSAPDVPPRAMSAADIARIEHALDVVLPVDYAACVQREDRGDIDATSVWDHADLVIEQTLEYCAGANGPPPWPPQLVCIGDEDDACPRVLDCEAGACWRLERGSLDACFDRFDSFTAFINHARGANAFRPKSRPAA